MRQMVHTCLKCPTPTTFRHINTLRQHLQTTHNIHRPIKRGPHKNIHITFQEVE